MIELPAPWQRLKSPFKDVAEQLAFVMTEFEALVNQGLDIIERRGPRRELHRQLLVAKGTLNVLRQMGPPGGGGDKPAPVRHD